MPFDFDLLVKEYAELMEEGYPNSIKGELEESARKHIQNAMDNGVSPERLREVVMGMTEGKKGGEKKESVYRAKRREVLEVPDVGADFYGTGGELPTVPKENDLVFSLQRDGGEVGEMVCVKERDEGEAMKTGEVEMVSFVADDGKKYGIPKELLSQAVEMKEDAKEPEETQEEREARLRQEPWTNKLIPPHLREPEMWKTVVPGVRNCVAWCLGNLDKFQQMSVGEQSSALGKFTPYQRKITLPETKEGKKVFLAKWRETFLQELQTSYACRVDEEGFFFPVSEVRALARDEVRALARDGKYTLLGAKEGSFGDEKTRSVSFVRLYSLKGSDRSLSAFSILQRMVIGDPKMAEGKYHGENASLLTRQFIRKKLHQLVPEHMANIASAFKFWREKGAYSLFWGWMADAVYQAMLLGESRTHAKGLYEKVEKEYLGEQEVKDVLRAPYHLRNVEAVTEGFFFSSFYHSNMSYDTWVDNHRSIYFFRENYLIDREASSPSQHVSRMKEKFVEMANRAVYGSFSGATAYRTKDETFEESKEYFDRRRTLCRDGGKWYQRCGVESYSALSNNGTLGCRRLARNRLFELMDYYQRELKGLEEEFDFGLDSLSDHDVLPRKVEKLLLRIPSPLTAEVGTVRLDLRRDKDKKLFLMAGSAGVRINQLITAGREVIEEEGVWDKEYTLREVAEMIPRLGLGQMFSGGRTDGRARWLASHFDGGVLTRHPLFLNSSFFSQKDCEDFEFFRGVLDEPGQFLNMGEAKKGEQYCFVDEGALGRRYVDTRLNRLISFGSHTGDLSSWLYRRLKKVGKGEMTYKDIFEDDYSLLSFLSSDKETQERMSFWFRRVEFWESVLSVDPEMYYELTYLLASFWSPYFFPVQNAELELSVGVSSSLEGEKKDLTAHEIKDAVEIRNLKAWPHKLIDVHVATRFFNGYEEKGIARANRDNAIFRGVDGKSPIEVLGKYEKSWDRLREMAEKFAMKRLRHDKEAFRLVELGLAAGYTLDTKEGEHVLDFRGLHERFVKSFGLRLDDVLEFAKSESMVDQSRKASEQVLSEAQLQAMGEAFRVNND